MRRRPPVPTAGAGKTSSAKDTRSAKRRDPPADYRRRRLRAAPSERGALQVQLVDDRSQRGGRSLELLGFRLVDLDGHLVLDAAGADDRGHGQHDIMQAVLAVNVVGNGKNGLLVSGDGLADALDS